MTSLHRAALLLVATLAGAREARAHIHLTSPPSWTTEDSSGDPQKSAPCGGEGGTPTGTVTTFKPGQTITVKWTETVYHPGHFRIAFATDRAGLQDPMVTVDQNQISVSATIENPPVAPVLLDNLYPRTDVNGSAGTTFQQDVTLPDMTCAKCTLQVIQFMAQHGPPNYIYHHCADIQLSNDAPASGGSSGGMGGCTLAGRARADGWAPWALAALLLGRALRRRSRREIYDEGGCAII